MQKLEFRAMGCRMLSAIDSDEPEAKRALAEAPVWFEEWEQSLSRFRSDSELNALNRAAGEPVAVSEVLWQAIGQALAAAQASGGIVTPAVLDAMEAAGYDKSFELIAPGPKDFTAETAEHAERNARVGDWREIRLDERRRTVRLPKGMRIDLGGTAKGWAAGEAVKRLAVFGPALMDAGGDIAVSGPMANGAGWPLGVQDPHQQDGDLAIVQLSDGAIATSGRDYRRWQANGRAQHHLIDPRTGRPAETDVLTATVIAPTAAEAEMAAKIVLIRGSLPGRRWLDEHPNYAGLMTLDEAEPIASRRWAQYLYHEYA